MQRADRPITRDSLKDRAGRASSVSVAGQLVSQSLRLVSNVILSRLLFPEAFGLMAIVLMVHQGMELASNLGVPQAVIRHERDRDRDFLDTAWTIQLIRGALLWLIGSSLAPLVAGIYEKPELVWIIPVATFGAFLGGAQPTKLFTTTRELMLTRLIAVEIFGQASGLVAAVAFAWIHPSVWALVFAGLSSSSVKLVLSHLLIPGAWDRPRWNRAAASEILHYGKWLTLGSLFEFVAAQIDVAILGRLLPTALLGVYSIGNLVPGAIRDIVTRLTYMVLMPALSESHRESRALGPAFRASLEVALPVCLAALLSAAAVAPAFFRYLYDDRYEAAGWIAQLAMLRFWFEFLRAASGVVLLVRGDSRTYTLTNAIRVVAVGTGCVVGLKAGGLPGVLIGIGLGALCGHLAVVIPLARLGISAVGIELRYTAIGLVLGTAGLWAPRLAAHFFGSAVPLMTLLWSAVFVAPFALWAVRRVLREIRAA